MLLLIIVRIVGWGLLSLITLFKWPPAYDALAIALRDWQNYCNSAYSEWKSFLKSIFDAWESFWGDNTDASQEEALHNSEQGAQPANRVKVDTMQGVKASNAAIFDKDSQATQGEFSMNEDATLLDDHSEQESTIYQTDMNNDAKSSHKFSPTDNSIEKLKKSESVKNRQAQKKEKLTQKIKFAHKQYKESKSDQQFAEMVASDIELAKAMLEELWLNRSVSFNLFTGTKRKLSKVDYGLRLLWVLQNPVSVPWFYKKAASIEKGDIDKNACKKSMEAIEQCFKKADLSLKKIKTLPIEAFSAAMHQLTKIIFNDKFYLWTAISTNKAIVAFMRYVCEQSDHQVSLQQLTALQENVLYVLQLLAHKEHSFKSIRSVIEQFQQQFANDPFFELLERDPESGCCLIEIGVLEPITIINFLNTKPQYAERIAIPLNQGLIFRLKSERHLNVMQAMLDTPKLREALSQKSYNRMVRLMMTDWQHKLDPTMKQYYERLIKNDFKVSESSELIVHAEPEIEEGQTYFSKLPLQFLGGALANEWRQDRIGLSQLFIEILGAEQAQMSALESKLRSRYKQLALKYHPDKNAQDKNAAAYIFNTIQTAFERFKKRLESKPIVSESTLEQAKFDEFVSAISQYIKEMNEQLQHFLDEQHAQSKAVKELLEQADKHQQQSRRELDTLKSLLDEHGEQELNPMTIDDPSNELEKLRSLLGEKAAPATAPSADGSSSPDLPLYKVKQDSSTDGSISATAQGASLSRHTH